MKDKVKNTMQVVRSIDRSERLKIPDTCPADYSKLINECWATDPTVRPPFTSVLVSLEKMRSEYQAQKASATVAQDPTHISVINAVANGVNGFF